MRALYSPAAGTSFSHRFHVFEVTPVSPVQVEALLVSNPDALDNRLRADRVTTGACIASLKVIIDNQHKDEFAVGQQFIIRIEPQNPLDGVQGI